MENEKKNNPLLVLLIIINTVFVIFILVKQFQINKVAENSSSKTSTVAEENDELPTLYNGLKARENHIFEQIEFKEMHANFQKDTGPKRFLKLSFILVIDTPQSRPLAEAQSMKPKMRDGIYSLINNTKSKQALRLEGRSAFKENLIERINRLLKKDKVVRVLFKTFLVK